MTLKSLEPGGGKDCDEYIFRQKLHRSDSGSNFDTWILCIRFLLGIWGWRWFWGAVGVRIFQNEMDVCPVNELSRSR